MQRYLCRLNVQNTPNNYCMCPFIPIVSEDDWVHHSLDRSVEILGKRTQKAPGAVSAESGHCTTIH